MDIICSPAGIVSGEYPKQGMADLARAGFSGTILDFCHFCSPGELEWFGRKRKIPPRKPLVSENLSLLAERARPFREAAKANGLSLPVAQAPYLPPETKRRDLEPLLEAVTAESLRAAGAAGCRFLIVKPSFAGAAAKDGGDIWPRNAAVYRRLAPLARENGVTILLMNQYRDWSGHPLRGLLSDGAEAAACLDRLNDEVGEERFGFCLDLGAANLCGQNAYEFILPLGRRLRAVLLTENDGCHPASLLPFTAARQGQSRLDWLNVLRGLRAICFDETIILHLGDTAASFSPILRPSLLALAKATADYIGWQAGMENLLRRYPSRVLFGAGNMCRAYMKCYGDTFPPLFTCDNNPGLWGTEFCGLSVKPPESLKSLPADTAIFICNVYYREIEEQLRALDVPNPIEYFNDEYMPSFHFERLEEEEGRHAKARRADTERD